MQSEPVNVIVVDDEEGILSTLQTVLAKAGYQVQTARNGREAAEAAAKTQPRLVITDILMPDADGIETIIALKRRYSAMKAIAMSGGGQSGRLDYLQMAKRLGADAVIEKPFHPNELLELVEKTIASE